MRKENKALFPYFLICFKKKTMNLKRVRRLVAGLSVGVLATMQCVPVLADENVVSSNPVILEQVTDDGSVTSEQSATSQTNKDQSTTDSSTNNDIGDNSKEDTKSDTEDDSKGDTSSTDDDVIKSGMLQITQSVDKVSSVKQEQKYTFNVTSDGATAYKNGTTLKIDFEKGFNLGSFSTGDWSDYEGTLKYKIYDTSGTVEEKSATEKEVIDLSKYTSISSIEVIADEEIPKDTEITDAFVSGILDVNEIDKTYTIKASYLTTDEAGDDKSIFETKKETICTYYQFEKPTLTVSPTTINQSETVKAVLSGIFGEGNLSVNSFNIKMDIPSRMITETIELPQFENETTTLYVDGKECKVEDGTTYKVSGKISSIEIKVTVNGEIKQTKEMSIEMKNTSATEGDESIKATIEGTLENGSTITTSSDSVSFHCNATPYYNLSKPTLTVSPTTLNQLETVKATLSGVSGEGNLSVNSFSIKMNIPSRMITDTITLPQFENATTALFIDGTERKINDETTYNVSSTVSSIEIKVTVNGEIKQTKEMIVEMRNTSASEGDESIKATIEGVLENDSTVTASSDSVSFHCNASSITPEPTPDPKPTPDPEPTPDPAPSPAPNPSPDPNPSQDPDKNNGNDKTDSGKGNGSSDKDSNNDKDESDDKDSKDNKTNNIKINLKANLSKLANSNSAVASVIQSDSRKTDTLKAATNERVQSTRVYDFADSSDTSNEVVSDSAETAILSEVAEGNDQPAESIKQSTKEKVEKEVKSKVSSNRFLQVALILFGLIVIISLGIFFALRKTDKDVNEGILDNEDGFPSSEDLYTESNTGTKDEDQDSSE